MTYFCGWDGGGTKTEVLIGNGQGQIIARECFGPLNVNGAGRERVGQTIRDCVAFMASQPGGLEAFAALAIGCAGVSNLEVRSFLTGELEACGYRGPVSLQGDQDIALAGAVEGPGAVLVAGTGSVCRAQGKNGEPFRTGGYGYLIDDEGSGYAIGRDILTAVVRAFDGRLNETCLTQMVFEQLGVTSIPEIITWLYAPSTGKKEIASLAPLMLRGLEEQDEACTAIAKKAAGELSQLVLAAWRKLELDEGELCFIGSILLRCELVRTEVERMCLAQYPRMRIIPARGTPAQGALKIAMGMKHS